MNKTLKWILIGLGIALVVFIIATVVFSAVFMHGTLGLNRLNYGFVMPHMRVFPFGGMFLLGRGLFWLVVIGLAVTGVVLLVRSGSSKSAPPAQLPSQTKVCQSCGKELHASGEFCPHCGAKQQPPAA
jgi:hypothetical protein